MSDTGQPEEAKLFDEIRSAVRSAYPPPPREWSDLRQRFTDLDAGRVRLLRRPTHPVPIFRVHRRWLAAAASILIGIVVFRLSTQTTLSAAELLRDASAAEGRTGVAKRVRVTTRSGAPATERFESVKYNWREPLSVRSFADWRNGLEKKDDRVQTLRDTTWGKGKFYRVTTATPEGPLAQASITIRADDLRAVHERFEFRDGEWVEAVEAPADPAQRPSTIPPKRLAEGPVSPPSGGATVSDELRVIAALHSIRADLGEPVDVKRTEGRIHVVALTGTPEREGEIRTALAGLAFVDLKFERPEAVRTVTGRREDEAEPPRNSPLLDRLAAQLGGRGTVENFTNHLIDLSEAALARAHALRSLAVRFPADVEADLPDADRRTLAALEADHMKYLSASVRQLSEVIRPVANAPAVSVDAWADWQSGTGSVLKSALELDRIVTDALAGSGGGDPDAALGRLASAAAGLQGRTAALQQTIAKSK